eukprot:scaffold762_cov363-Pavlova_lutheri.AAC.59
MGSSKARAIILPCCFPFLGVLFVRQAHPVRVHIAQVIFQKCWDPTSTPASPPRRTRVGGGSPKGVGRRAQELREWRSSRWWNSVGSNDPSSWGVGNADLDSEGRRPRKLPYAQGEQIQPCTIRGHEKVDMASERLDGH